LRSKTTVIFEGGIRKAVMINLEETNVQDPRVKLSLIHRYVQALCGLYSRVARQLSVDRSYVSRVARGERHSQQVEAALATEFDRIVDKNEGRAA
jgi:hypothetical protein